MVKLQKTTLITLFCISLLAGVGLARRLTFEPDYWIILAALSLLILRSSKLLKLIAIVALGLGLGLWRGSLYMQNVYELKGLSGHKVTIVARAHSDSVYGNRSQIEFTANNIKLGSKNSKPLAGSFKISGFGVPMVYRGDTVSVSGKLYPMRGSNQARIAYAQLERLSADNNYINKLTRSFDAGMQNALPEPQASFGLGLLIGQRTNLPKDILSSLTAVGLVHIVAVSGYNLTILVRAVGRLKLGSKYQKLMLSMALIAAFILVTGFSASIVRAGLVSVLGLWAWYYGRQFKPVVLIAIAVAITALWNPFYVWSDLGWYLSFLAFFGVLVIAPIISAKLFSKPPKMLTMVVLETLSAEIMTLPLILMTFSQLSLVALLANALIVPIVPLAMLLSAIAGVAGALVPQIAGWFAFPARMILTYMLDIVHSLSNIPSVLIHRSIGLEYMLAIYSIVLFVLVVGYSKLAKNQKTYEDEFVQITP
jgi:competence protein ComEC